MSWILFVALFAIGMVACRGTGWGACGSHRAQLAGGRDRYGHRARSHARGEGRFGDRAPRERRRHADEAGRGRPVAFTPAQRREQAITELRRRYVADEITVEEFEAGVDRILREPGEDE